MKTIQEHQTVDHGVDNSQYFQGCGTAFTDFADVATGIGDSASEAFEDACEQLAQLGWDTSTLTDDLSDEIDVPEDSEDCYHYVSIRVK